MNSCLATLRGHDDEVLDLTFDNNGKKLASASSDTTARVWDVTSDFQQLALMKGHREEVSKGDCVCNQIIPFFSFFRENATSKILDTRL